MSDYDFKNQRGKNTVYKVVRSNSFFNVVESSNLVWPEGLMCGNGVNHILKKILDHSSCSPLPLLKQVNRTSHCKYNKSKP